MPDRIPKAIGWPLNRLADRLLALPDGSSGLFLLAWGLLVANPASVAFTADARYRYLLHMPEVWLGLAIAVAGLYQCVAVWQRIASHREWSVLLCGPVWLTLAIAMFAGSPLSIGGWMCVIHAASNYAAARMLGRGQ